MLLRAKLFYGSTLKVLAACKVWVKLYRLVRASSKRAMQDTIPMSLQVTKLCDFGSGDGADIVCSVAWSQRGTYLSVGTHSGEAQIWDVSKIKLCAPVLCVLF